MPIDFILNKLKGIPTVPTKAKNPKALQFPADLFAEEKCDNVPHVIIDLKDTTVGSAVLYSIALYMPSNIGVNYSGNWEHFVLENKVNTASYVTGAAAGVKGMKEAMAAYQNGQFTGLVKDVAEQATQGRTFKEQLAAKRVLTNPFQAHAYQGPSHREFQFTFSMVARNRSESNSIANIINVLKWGMHPGIEPNTLGTTWQYPNVFDVHLFSAKNKSEYLFKMKECILSDVQIVYGPESANFFTATSAPVDINLILSFKESKFLTKLDFGTQDEPQTIGNQVTGQGNKAPH